MSTGTGLSTATTAPSKGTSPAKASQSQPGMQGMSGMPKSCALRPKRKCGQFSEKSSAPKFRYGRPVCASAAVAHGGRLRGREKHSTVDFGAVFIPIKASLPSGRLVCVFTWQQSRSSCRPCAGSFLPHRRPSGHRHGIRLPDMPCPSAVWLLPPGWDADARLLHHQPRA